MCQLVSLTVMMVVVVVSYLANMKPEVLFPDSEEGMGQGMKATAGGVEEYLKVREHGLEKVYDENSGEYNFGRYRKPPKDAGVHGLNPAQIFAQHKEWHWTSLYTDTVIVGMATLQFGYASHAIAYYYNTATDEFHDAKFEVLLAGLLLGAKHLTSDGRASSLTEGCSKWGFRGTIEQCGGDRALASFANVTVDGGKTLEVSFEIDLGEDESLNFVYPIGRKRPAIVSKLGGNPAKGHVSVDGTRVDLSGYGMVDWTRSLAARLTVWNWAAFSFSTPDARVGVQISAGVYEDPAGNGVESCIMVNGRVHVLDVKVAFAKPEDPARIGIDDWEVTTPDNSVQYTFTPRKAIGGEFHLYVLDGNLQHIVGRATGQVTVDGKTYEFTNIPAVMEEHYALW